MQQCLLVRYQKGLKRGSQEKREFECKVREAEGLDPLAPPLPPPPHPLNYISCTLLGDSVRNKAS